MLEVVGGGLGNSNRSEREGISGRSKGESWEGRIKRMRARGGAEKEVMRPAEPGPVVGWSQGLGEGSGGCMGVWGI